MKKKTPITNCPYKIKIQLYSKRVYLVSNHRQALLDIATVYPHMTSEVTRVTAQDVIAVVKNKVVTISYQDELLFTHTSAQKCLVFLEWLINSLFLNKLNHLLHIHAGAVSANNSGILFPANNEVGKSTFTFYLTQKGFNYYSDEIGLIDPKTKRIFPFPKSISLVRKKNNILLNYFDMSNIATIKGAEKTYYQPEVLGNDLKNGAPLKYIFFLKRKSTAKKPLTECSKGEALIELIKNSFNPLANSEKNFNQLMKLMVSVQAFFLDVSNPELAYKSLCEVIKKR